MGKGFEDLEVYQEARVLRRRVYKLTALLPPEERMILFLQMRRAALSATNCIAEGHGSRSYRHNISYLYRSRGSACELQDDFNVCEDEGYFPKKHLDDIRRQAVKVVKLTNGYVAYLERRLTQDLQQRSRLSKRQGGQSSNQRVNELTSQPVKRVSK